MKKLTFFIALSLFVISHPTFSQVLSMDQLKIAPIPNKENRIKISSDLNVVTTGRTPEEKAFNYLKENWASFGHYADLDNTLVHYKTREMKSGNIVRFRQRYKGMRVGMHGVTIKINNRGAIRTVINSSVPIPQNFDVTPKISADKAYERVAQHLRLAKKIKDKLIGLSIEAINGKPVLVYEVWTDSRGLGRWCSAVDAKTGEILLAAEQALHVNGTGRVFEPNPVVSAKTPYEEGTDYSDNNDVTNATLESQMIEVELKDITLDPTDNKYYLIGPNAQIWDSDEGTPEAEGLYEQSSPDFLFDRSNRAFEAVMCYHYLDKSLRYISDDLGYDDIEPTYAATEGSLKFDPHALNFFGPFPGAVFSWFTDPLTSERSDEYLLFGDGDGDVDMGEDATTIIHESAHAVHYWMTDANLSNNEGVSEAICDFWSKSQTKTCGLTGVWKEWEPEFHEIFQWGGMPTTAEFQRATDFAGTNYSPNASGNNGDIYETSQYLSTALMKIYSDIGKDKTEVLVMEALAMMEGDGNTVIVTDPAGTNLREAGIFIYNTAIDLGYTSNELCIIYKHLDHGVKIGTNFISDPTPAVPAPTGGTLDVYMKDGPCDSGVEPNDVTQWMFHSPDIWVRHERDGGLEHQNPEYKGPVNNNYIYVRVRSRGCESEGNMQLRLYWSKANTGLNWPDDWTTADVLGPNGMVPAGREITALTGPISIPFTTGNGTLEAGEERIINVNWNVPNPADYFTDVHHFCILAKLEHVDDPITFTETGSTGNNARNNNNITAKNVSIFDDDPNNVIKGPVSTFIGCSPSLTNGGIRVESAQHPLGKSIFDYGNVYLELLGALHTDWTGKGQPGSSYQVQQDGKVLVMDGAFHLDSLNLSSCSHEVVNVYFEPFAGAGECAFDVVQYNKLDGIVEVQGRERFEYYPVRDDSQGERSSEEGSQILRKSNGILLFPNPVGASVSVMLPNEMDWEGMQFQLCDFQGALLQADGSNGQMTGRTSEIPLTGLPPGMYLIKLIDGTGKLVESLKFVKQ